MKPYLSEGQPFSLGLKVSDICDSTLNKIGAPSPIAAGDFFVPSAIGKTTNFNAHGDEIVDRSGGKETLYRMVDRSWTDWHGNPHSGVSAVAYKRWPRTLVEPPEEELQISEINGELFITTRRLIFSNQNDDEILHCLNLFLECFQECELLNKDGEAVQSPRLKKRNWTLLPQGAYPWAQAKSHIQSVTNQLPKNEQIVIDYRMQKISAFSPDILAIGLGGFNGYFAFGFTDKKLFVLESIHLDNATYILNEDWEKLSNLSKREIIQGNLHEARIVHSGAWYRNLKRFIG
ncbi:MAG: hypothetical protein Q7Q71_08020 [Verrucomicrobiota bacterium JB023]|nr:hypothetical protein [Verrucomicrobiota bacterium JB023]